MTPRTAALAYRIWAYATPREWDVTIPEIAEALGEPLQRVNIVLQHKGWLDRVRRVTARESERGSFRAGRHTIFNNNGQRSAERQTIREIVGTEGLPE